MRKWQAIVFDLDDILYPENEYVLSGFRAVSRWAEDNLGIPADNGYGVLRHLFDAGVRGDTFNRWLDAFEIKQPGVVQQLVNVYREHEPTITPFPGIEVLIRKLRQYYRLGIVSDGYLEVQRRKFAALGLASFFDAVVLSDMFGREFWKPSTKPFEAVLTTLDVDACHAVYIADNPLKDFLGARRIGMATIWVRRQKGEYIHHEPPTPDHAPDQIAYTLEDLQMIFATKEGVV